MTNALHSSCPSCQRDDTQLGSSSQGPGPAAVGSALAREGPGRGSGVSPGQEGAPWGLFPPAHAAASRSSRAEARSQEPELALGALPPTPEQLLRLGPVAPVKRPSLTWGTESPHPAGRSKGKPAAHRGQAPSLRPRASVPGVLGSLWLLLLSPCEGSIYTRDSGGRGRALGLFTELRMTLVL